MSTPALERARSLIRDYPLPDGCDLTPEWLERFFYWVIQARSVGSPWEKTTVPLGGSKTGGCPDLPASAEWPSGHYFFAQLDTKDLAPLDPLGFLPGQGLLSFFFDPSNSSARLLYSRDTALERRDYLPKSLLPYGGKYYYKEFTESERGLRFEPRFMFSVYRVAEELPELLEALAEVVGGAYVRSEDLHAGIYGTPIVWQGHDKDDLLADAILGPENWDWQHDPPPSFDHMLLLYQDCFGEGNVHFWYDTNRGPFQDENELVVTYSGT